MPHKPRIYLDTSVFGGYFEPEFDRATRNLVRRCLGGELVAVISDVVMAELQRAPDNVIELFGDMAYDSESVETSNEALDLMREYLNRKVLHASNMADALHVAIATVSKCDALVSWNFKHIVNFGLMEQYNSINEGLGYSELVIVTPQAFLEDNKSGQ